MDTSQRGGGPAHTPSRSDRAETDQSFVERRSEPRYPFNQVVSVMLMFHPSIGAVRVKVQARNLSRHGMAFLYDGPVVSPNTDCTVFLTSKHGEVVHVEAAAVRVRSISEGVQEVGLRFSRPIDPDAFIDA